MIDSSKTDVHIIITYINPKIRYKSLVAWKACGSLNYERVTFADHSKLSITTLTLVLPKDKWSLLILMRSLSGLINN